MKTHKITKPIDYANRKWMQIWLAITIIILYAPIITLMVFSFNDSRRNIVWRGFTTKYYQKAWNNDTLIEAFTNSLSIALAATLIATLIGAATAIILWRFRFPGKFIFEGTVALPVVIPEICMGVALLMFFARSGWPTNLPYPLNLSQVTFAHVAFCFPFVTIIARARLQSFNTEIEEAARDLGAGEWKIIKDMIIPHMKPALIAGALLAFTLSLDDFVITFFTTGPDVVTFPVKVYSMVRFSVTPEVNAASTILIIITIIITLIAARFQSVVKPQKET